jgi:penicillin-binding protein 1A
MTANGRNGKNGKNGRNGNGNGHRAADNRQRRRRRNRRRQDRTQSRRFILVSLLAIVLGGVAILVAAAFTGAQAFRNSCSLASLRPVSIGQNSFVYAADGTVLGAIKAEKNRQPVALDQMSPLLAQATVAIEDRRFYSHSGIDYEGIVRAAVENLQSGEIVQGGSTLTQQLVRNLYIGNEVSWERKTKEACLALKLEEEGLPTLWAAQPAGLTAGELKGWRKERILETYLNQVYFGSHAYGAEAAAQTYFSKHAKNLNLVQAALIAGLPQAPSIYDPFKRPGEAQRRRDEVLKAMKDAGYIDLATYVEAIDTPLGLKAGELYTKIREPYFFGYVSELLIEKYGASTVRGGGLKVYTTINPRYQKLAVRAMRDTLGDREDPSSAIVSINPKNGAIRAMTAVNPNNPNVEFNYATQGKRQTGSSFKTFVLVTAVRQGINPFSTSYLSAPLHWQPDPNSEAWDVATYSHSYLGSVPISSATLSSDNTVYARLTLDVGPENVVKTARQMGIKTKLLAVPSIGLGSNSVSVIEMASAYATLASGGVFSEPMAIKKVVLASGEVDRTAGWGKPKRRRVLTDGQAAAVTEILQSNMTGGTGTGAYYGDPYSAGKTGTTDDYVDAWFAGYTPRASTVVWVGYPNAQIEMNSVHGIAVAGGTFPADIWHLFMEGAFGGLPYIGWPDPKNPAVWADVDLEYANFGAPPPPKKPKKPKNNKPGTTTEPPGTTEPPPTTTEPPPTTTGPG